MGAIKMERLCSRFSKEAAEEAFDQCDLKSVGLGAQVQAGSHMLSRPMGHGTVLDDLGLVATRSPRQWKDSTPPSVLLGVYVVHVVRCCGSSCTRIGK